MPTFRAVRLNLRLPRPSLRGQGLTLQLFIFIVLPLAMLLLVIPLGSLILHQRAMRLLVGERDARAAQAAAATLAEQLHHRATALQGLAPHAATTDSPEQALAASAFLLPDFDGGLALFAPDGELLAASVSPETWQARPVVELLAQTAAAGEPQFSATFSDPVEGEPMMLVAAGTVNGPIVVGAFSPEGLARRAFADAFSSSKEAAVFIVDGDGRVIYHAGSSPAELELAQHPGVTEALRGERGTTYRSVWGSEHVVAFSPVVPVGWALVIEEPWKAVDSPLLRVTQAAPLILIPVLIFALVALGFGIRQVVQPLRSLEHQAAEVAGGRFEAIETPAGGIAEIRRLQAVLIHMARQIKAAQQSLRGYVSVLTAGQEEERGRLARELHDDTVQALVALDQRVQLAQLASRDGSPQAAERLAEVRRMTGALIEGVRRVVRALRPVYLEDLGLSPAIEMLTRDLQTTLGVQVIFTGHSYIGRLPPEREIALYRIAQEALSNVARHARATLVRVTLASDSSGLLLRVQDDGQGFMATEQVNDLAAAGHYGLIGMRERAERIGARLTIHSAPGSGTIIEVRLPL